MKLRKYIAWYAAVTFSNDAASIILQKLLLEIMAALPLQFTMPNKDVEALKKELS